MRKIILTFSLIVLSFTLYSNEVEVDRAVEESVTKDYDQDGVYSSYEKALGHTPFFSRNRIIEKIKP